MSELISRQKLIEGLMECSMVGIGKRNPKGSKEEMLYEDYIKLDTVLELIESQPPADSGPDTNDGTNQWIPCSERLPKESKAYEVTIINSNNERFTMPLYYSEEYKTWATRNNVIAWRERLEPYKGGWSRWIY